MADTPTFQSNPYGSFDPTQWSNPYSQFFGRALPWPSSYSGTPTNALGQPIATPQGMTLNQTPAQPQAPAAAQTFGLQPSQLAAPSALNPTGNQAFGMANWGGMMSPQANELYRNQQFAQPGSSPGQQAAAAQAAGPQQGAAPAGNNWQTALAMLANPGHVTTPGATVPQAAPNAAQASPGVLQNFLANWQPQQSGPGSGFTQNFNTILRGLQAKGS
jgi:hypothetical protein